MAGNYYITINGEKICVSEEVYNAYRQMRRHTESTPIGSWCAGHASAMIRLSM